MALNRREMYEVTCDRCGNAYAYTNEDFNTETITLCGCRKVYLCEHCFQRFAKGWNSFIQADVSESKFETNQKIKFA